MSRGRARRTAYHEAGHALLGMLMPGADPVRKVSIIPRGQALGVTFQTPEADRYGYYGQVPAGPDHRRARRSGGRGARLRRSHHRCGERSRPGDQHRPADGGSLGDVRRDRPGHGAPVDRVSPVVVGDPLRGTNSTHRPWASQRNGLIRRISVIATPALGRRRRKRQPTAPARPTSRRRGPDGARSRARIRRAALVNEAAAPSGRRRRATSSATISCRPASDELRHVLDLAADARSRRAHRQSQAGRRRTDRTAPRALLGEIPCDPRRLREAAHPAGRAYTTPHPNAAPTCPSSG